jgi:hypothetical protein
MTQGACGERSPDVLTIQGDPLIEMSPGFRFLSLFPARERKVRGVPDGEEVWS